MITRFHTIFFEHNSFRTIPWGEAMTQENLYTKNKISSKSKTFRLASTQMVFQKTYLKPLTPARETSRVKINAAMKVSKN